MMDLRGSLRYSIARLQLMAFQMNCLLMEAPSSLLMPQGHFCLTGVFTTGLALWLSLIAIVEVGVKTVKRLLTNNVGPGGNLNVDTFQKAILQYRNTPDKDTKLSPAMCIFGRPIKDLIPILPGKYQPHPVWKESLLAREDALRKRHIANHERWKNIPDFYHHYLWEIMSGFKTRWVIIPTNGIKPEL